MEDEVVSTSNNHIKSFEHQNLLRSFAVGLYEDLDLRCSLLSALGSFVVVWLIAVSIYSQQYFIFILVGSALICAFGLALFWDWKRFWNSVQASLLGSVFAISFVYITADVSIAFFHYSEYVMTALASRRDLRNSSYLLNHSVEYWLAAFTSWTEFSLESYFWPNSKSDRMAYCGLTMVFLGEVLRKMAMLHARGGFTHLVANRKKSNHELVTNGVYGWVRHPGYLGWFIWCVGTQVILSNPVCVVLYALVSWKFFSDRIRWEESCLISFFGLKYINYQRNVPSGIPFVKGFQVDKFAT
ncbi:unnamed protein product [Anisakis simplex]|uniref:Protein-S-isoprenylcysteine O-methyltransferase n=1 Tax=Anisakis simplex TaxID=6269 RepID=A0A0M3K5K9_ANISI|nr:unnamed protein product [Anisakis simplex]